MTNPKHWNWQQKDWPKFQYDSAQLIQLEANFLQKAGTLSGAFMHVSDDDQNILRVQMISEEALKTSEIEGEMLNRDSIQSSIRKNLGLQIGSGHTRPAEQGIADLMLDLYQNYDAPLTHQTLFSWYQNITRGRRDLDETQGYRTHEEPMQVVSGYMHAPKIHFEAPPSAVMKRGMDAFLSWFNATSPTGSKPLPALARASIAHLYFVSIHPFEDGNGRIARALAEKALAQTLGAPTLIALSHTIARKKKAYYDELENNNKQMEVTDWQIYFAETILTAQRRAQELVNFVLAKTKLFDRLRHKLNDRQTKVLTRMFREGPDGFNGGLSAKNYLTIAQTSQSTATRDLSELVEIGVLRRTGDRKATRYYLVLP